MVSLPLKTMKDKHPWMKIIPKGLTNAELLDRVIHRADHLFPKPKETAIPESGMETRKVR